MNLLYHQNHTLSTIPLFFLNPFIKKHFFFHYYFFYIMIYNSLFYYFMVLKRLAHTWHCFSILIGLFCLWLAFDWLIKDLCVWLLLSLFFNFVNLSLLFSLDKYGFIFFKSLLIIFLLFYKINISLIIRFQSLYPWEKMAFLRKSVFWLTFFWRN